MGLTDRRKTAKNLADSRKNWKISLAWACVASVSVWFRSKERPRFWPREKWNKSQKMKVGGGGGERRKRLQTNPSILKTCVRQRTQHLIGSASRTVLTCVNQRFVSYWEDGMVRDMYINFQWLLFILVGKICQRIFFDLFWNVRLFLRLNKVSGRLIYSLKCLLDMNN